MNARQKRRMFFSFSSLLVSIIYHIPPPLYLPLSLSSRNPLFLVGTGGGKNKEIKISRVGGGLGFEGYRTSWGKRAERRGKGRGDLGTLLLGRAGGWG